MAERIVPRYTKKIKIPEMFKRYLWDCPEGNTYMEKLILRVLQYGSYEEIIKCFKKFPEETYDIVKRYPLRRGVKFWIEYWYKRENAETCKGD